MSIVIKGHTEYTYDVLLAFNNMLLSRKKALWITLAAVGGCAIGASFALLFLYEYPFFFPMLGIICGCGAIAYILALLLIPRFSLRTSPSLGTRIDYTLGDDGIDMLAVSSGTSAAARMTRMVEHTRIDYGAISLVRETRRFVYVFVGSGGAYVIDKWHIDKGCDGDLLRMLADKLPPPKLHLRRVRK